jgi:hypothetical protein
MNSPLDTSKPARVETVLVLDDAKGTTVLCQLGLPRTLPSSRATKFKVAPSAIKNGAIWAAAGADDFFVGEFRSFCCRIIRHACS